MKTIDAVSTHSGAMKVAAPVVTTGPTTPPADVREIGGPDLFKLLYSSWDYETKNGNSVRAMEFSGIGCLVRVTTQQGDNVAEALAFVPGVRLVDDVNGGFKFRSIA